MGSKIHLFFFPSRLFAKELIIFFIITLSLQQIIRQTMPHDRNLRIHFGLKLPLLLSFLMSSIGIIKATNDEWVAVWATAEQLVEPHNCPPAPGLAGNTLRQIVQVSGGGETVRLRLSGEFSDADTEMLSVTLAEASSGGSSADIDESTLVSLTFDGHTAVTIPAGGFVLSDPIQFPLRPRMDVAITICYGQTSATSITGHPGSRTTSYLATGSTDDFADAVPTDHWYHISAIHAVSGQSKRAIAVLGNSITDGRGTTTNGQDRWTDQLSRRLLREADLRDFTVLNFGLGGNCVLQGGLGPTGQSRYQRDLFNQPGITHIILFEGVNDIGTTPPPSKDAPAPAVTTARRLIRVYQQIISEAHERGLKVGIATITPIKHNRGYDSPDHEQGRQLFNAWVRTSHEADFIIDFEQAVCAPDDPFSLNPRFLFENDYLHPNAAGYQRMADAIDLDIFRQDYTTNK